MDFKNKDVLIVDDICVYGGTFIGLAKILKERNVGKLYLAVSHITIPNPSLDLEKCFVNIFTTNSKYDYYVYPEGHIAEGEVRKWLKVIKTLDL